MTDAKNIGFGQYASPPCFMHEIDDPAVGTSEQQRIDVARWRKAERSRQIESRLALPSGQRRAWGKQIADRLKESIGDANGKVVSAYWPFRGEPDLRVLMRALAREGALTALPVVIERGRPLIFRLWKEGDRLEKGVWNIPVPAEGIEVVPDVVIAPVVGFDPQNYRLGYGGGYFDRTLAAMSQIPRAFGVGYSTAAISTIYPQAHDIPMDAIITERDDAR